MSTPIRYALDDVIDPRTGRPIGDHGPSELAIRYALEVVDDSHDALGFLKAWNEGAAIDEWPEYYTWLAEQERDISPL